MSTSPSASETSALMAAKSPTSDVTPAPALRLKRVGSRGCDDRLGRRSPQPWRPVVCPMSQFVTASGFFDLHGWRPCIGGPEGPERMCQGGGGNPSHNSGEMGGNPRDGTTRPHEV